MEANESIKREILRLAAEENSQIVNCGWRWTKMGNLWYLVNITRTQSVSCAVWMRESTLTALYSGGGDTGKYLLYFRQDQYKIGWDGERTEQLPLDQTLVTEPSEEGNFAYCCVVRGEMGTVSHLIWRISAIGLLIAVFVCALISMFHHRVNQMLREIQAGLVRRGEDLSRSLPETRIKETDSVYQTLNDMSDKIRTLQANLYQHEINEQKSRVQVLHMQINSHFFRNCMNIIFSLAEVKNTRLIQDFCIYLIDYLNYINTAFQPSTPLREELVHLENYLTLQQMRYPGRVEWEIDADEEAKEFPILPLLLLTFVENVFKHGMIEGEVCIVRIQAVCQKRGGLQGLFIRIEDNDLPQINQRLNELLRERFDYDVHLVLPRASGYHQAIQAELTLGKQIDVAFCNNAAYLNQWVENGWLLPLDNLLAREGGGIRAWIADPYMYRLNGTIWGVGNNVERGRSYGFEYNLDLADEYGIDLKNVRSVNDLSAVFAQVRDRCPGVFPTVVYPNYYVPVDQLGNNTYGVLEHPEDTSIVNYYKTDAFWQLVELAYAWTQQGYTYDRFEDNNTLLYYMTSGNIFGSLCTAKPGFAAQESYLTGHHGAEISSAPVPG